MASIDKFLNEQRRRERQGGLGGLIGGPAPVAPPTREQQLLGEAGSIKAEEQQRYGAGLATATDAYNQSRQALSQFVDPNLLFSRASDAIGARAGANLNALRSSLGARGLSPNSGAASGMLSRLMFQREGELTGATRDVALENQRQRQVAAAQNFANALNLAGYQNSPVSGVMLDTYTNLFEGDIAREGIKSQRKSANKASKSSMVGGGLGAIGGIAAGL